MKKILILWMMALLLCTGCGNNVEEPSKEETDTIDTSSEMDESEETEELEETEQAVVNTEYIESYIEKIQEYEKNHAGSECTYDLIYVDNDDIPELVAGVEGFYVSLFAYYEGTVYTLMDDWGYGAMGNHGYLYLPGQNVVYNSNADFAGAIVYESYMGMKQYKELVPYYYLETRYFKDKNNNDMPDDNEYVDDPLYYYEGKQISEERAKDMAFDGKYEDISGSLTGEQIIDILWEKTGSSSSASKTTEKEEQ